MEKLKLNGTGVWGIPSLISNVLINMWNDLSNKINEVIDSIAEIDNIHNELVYKALLTQTGDNTPIARVLNATDDNFLGYIDWGLNAPGEILALFPPNIVKGLTTVVTSPNHQDLNNGFGLIENDQKIYVEIQENEVNIFTFVDGVASNGVLNDFYIEVKTKQRGESPNLIGIETNGTGYTVIVTFDKEMSNYNLNILMNAITLSGKNIIDINLDNANRSKVNFSLEPGNPFTSEDEIYFSFDASINWESLDLGLVAEIVDAAVVNNVEQLQS